MKNLKANFWRKKVKYDSFYSAQQYFGKKSKKNVNSGPCGCSGDCSCSGPCDGGCGDGSPT